MLNCNGVLIHSLSGAPENVLTVLHTSFSITEKIRLYRGKLLFWENHYFRILATLRRHRFEIPMSFTPSFLEQEIQNLVVAQPSPLLNGVVRFQCVATHPISFLISVEEASDFGSQPAKNFEVDVYKEVVIYADSRSNMSCTNENLFLMAKRYAAENGLADCILINDQKSIVEGLSGTLYLIQNKVLRTSPLESGCQDLVFRTVFNEWIRKQKEYELNEVQLTPFELQQTEEVFLLSLDFGVLPITHYRKTNYPSSLSTALFQHFLETLD
jgi:branched-chain amino acid aminotransferase